MKKKVYKLSELLKMREKRLASNRAWARRNRAHMTENMRKWRAKKKAEKKIEKSIAIV